MSVIEFPVWKVRPSMNANDDWIRRVLKCAYMNHPQIPPTHICDCAWRTQEGSIACLDCDDNPLMGNE